MSKRFLPREQALAEQLRREDVESRPEFSESLHRRIMEAVRQSRGAEADAAPKRSAHRGTIRWVAAAAAAACLVAAALFAWKQGNLPQTRDISESPGVARGPIAPPRPVANEPAAVDLSPVTALAGRFSTTVPALVDDSLASRQWAYLDHDARLTLDMLAGRLPLGLAAEAGASSSETTP